MTPNDLLSVIQDAWSEQTSPHWRPDMPCFGQGAVTALVIHDMFGGEIVKTEAPSGWHFYNLVEGERYDLTQDQFLEPLGYSDDPSNREEAMNAAREPCYRAMKARLKDMIG
ncbi:MAG TPA: hypothetical protein VFB13_06095 [Reyranella sp.]|jgi:hypothetical protein|nr:hypothetical protein [Reyranella sp.]